MGMPHSDPLDILLVEDDDDDYTLVCEVLSGLLTSGSTLRWVQDYDEALSTLLTGQFDVCLLDYQLGAKSGLQILKEAMRLGCGTPILFLTNMGDYETDYTVMKGGAAGYLDKGALSPPLLERTIRYCVQKAQIQKVLAMERRHYRRILDRLPYGIYIVDSRFHIDYLNPAIRGELGEPGDRKCYDYFHGLPAPCSWCRLKEVLQGQTVFGSSKSLINQRDYEYCNLPLYNEDGSVSKIAILNDITERKKAEQALRESEERYKNISRSVSDFVFSCTKRTGGDYELDWLAGGVENITGYSVQEVLDRGCWKFFVHPEDLPIFCKSVTGLEPGSSDQCELRIVHKDGSLRWIRAASSVAPQSGLPESHRLFGSCADITKRKQVDKMLWESEERYRLAMEATSDGLWDWDLVTGSVYYSSAYFRMLGYEPEDFFEKAKSWLLLVHPDDRERALAANKACIKNELQSFSVEFRMRSREGGWRWILGRGKAVRRNAKGIALQMIGTHVDITESKNAQQERERLQQQLRQSHKIESVGRLAGGVAHEYNNMLAVIMGYTEMALGRVGPDDRLRANLQEVLKAARRSAEVTRQLLAFARKQTVAPVVLNLNSTVESMLKMLRRLIGEDIDLVWLPGTQLPPVKMDPSQIDQILANLCMNARDALAKGGKIIIETDRITFDEAYCACHTGFVPGDFVLLAVSDNGCGMDRKTLENVFEPFFTTKEVEKGTGLGLSTVYGIVKQNDGFLNVYSEPGRGTTFKIYLPAVKTEASQDDRGQEKKRDLSGTETILLVEDEESLLDLGNAILKHYGYRVLTAHNPAEALTLARSHRGPIHLLITDVVMPEMNGLELRYQLEGLQYEFKFLYMSGYTANVIAQHGILEEGVNFLQKPFSVQTLAEKVREVLDA
ncbi:MAG: PAS domain-containing protein [Syntrophobacteraceae bacterium]